MNIRNALVWMTMAMSVVACGGDEEEEDNSQPATVNKQAAAATAQSTIAAVSATQSGSDVGLSSATSLSSVAQSSQNLLTPQAPGASTQSLASALKIEEAIGTLDTSSPGCECTAASCTFTKCSPGAGGSSRFTIDGSYSWAGGHVECKNLKYTFGVDSAGPTTGISSKVEVTLNCDLNITATSLKGYLQSAGSSNTEIAGQSTAQAFSSSWDIKTTYNDVTFGDSRQPTGGSIKVEGKTSTSAGGQQQAFSGSAEISFPAN